MPHFMLDTDISAFILRGPSQSLRAKLVDTPLAEQSISVVTLAELLYGVRLSTKPKQNKEALDAFLRHLTVHSWADSAAEHYADIRAQLRKKGQMLGANDLMIAAHARSMEAVLVTNNQSDFKRVPHLKIENWIS